MHSKKKLERKCKQLKRYINNKDQYVTNLLMSVCFSNYVMSRLDQHSKNYPQEKGLSILNFII